MAVADLIMWGTVGGGSGIGALGYVWLDKVLSKKKGPELIDGRTSDEWYEIIKGLGREEYERLSRGALDGLEESDKYGRWDVKPLLKGHYDKLMKEWYPNKYCSYCGNLKNSNGDCFWDGPCISRYRSANNICLDCGASYCKCPGIKTHPGAPVNPYRSKYQRVYKEIPVQNKIPSAPPRGVGAGTPVTRFVASRRKHYIAIMDIGYGSSKSAYRIVRDHENWLAGLDEIAAFQSRKGLQPTGRIDYQTKDALIRYLDAGNPWPVERPKAEIERIQRELQKWTNE